MATDISLLNNVIQITSNVGASNAQVTAYAKPMARYSFNLAGTIFNLALWPTMDTYSIDLTDLRLAGSGTAPANVGAALTSLSSIFQK